MLTFLFQTELLLYQSYVACLPLVSGVPLLVHFNLRRAPFLFTTIRSEFPRELQLPTQPSTDRAAACVPGLFTVRSQLAQGLQNQWHLWLQQNSPTMHHWCTAPGSPGSWILRHSQCFWWISCPKVGQNTSRSSRKKTKELQQILSVP